MRTKLGSIIWIGLTFVAGLSGETKSEMELPPKDNFHLFLLAGQSNMAGRGIIEDSDLVAHPRVFSLGKDGRWVPAVAPIHFDKSVAGVGLATAFAKVLVDKDPSITIGLIPAACGGSPISSWEPGGYHEQTKTHPYDDAMARVRAAMKDGVLKGILWHQGESDSKPELAVVYEKKLENLFEQFRNAFNVPNLPIVLGQLGQFPAKPWDEYRNRVNDAHISVAGIMPRVEFVPSNGLTPKSDNTHFDTKSLRIFGKRYAEAYLRVVE